MKTELIITCFLAFNAIALIATFLVTNYTNLHMLDAFTVVFGIMLIGVIVGYLVNRKRF